MCCSVGTSWGRSYALRWWIHHIRIICQGDAPIVQITEVGAEKLETMSALRLLLHKLLSSLFCVGEEDTNLEKSMKLAMHSNLSTYYTGDLLMMLNIAAFLDPRFRALSHSFLGKRNLFFLQGRKKLWMWPLQLLLVCVWRVIPGDDNNNMWIWFRWTITKKSLVVKSSCKLSDVIRQSQSPTENDLAEIRRYEPVERTFFYGVKTTQT